MKNIVCFLLLSCIPLYATTRITGTIDGLGPDSRTSNTKVRAWLRGCDGGQPRVNGVTMVAPSDGSGYYFDFAPNSSGAISGTLYSNDMEIECGGRVGATWYSIQIYSNGLPGPEVRRTAKNGTTLNVTDFIPITRNSSGAVPLSEATSAPMNKRRQPFLEGTATPGFPGSSANMGCYVGTSDSDSQYRSISSATSAGCHSIHLVDGYSETEAMDLVLPGDTALVADGRATIDLNGRNQIALTSGGFAADSLTFGSGFPWSAHGDGSNSGLQITGYKGTGCAILIGNSGGPTLGTENVYINNVNIQLGSGAGACGIDLLNVQNFQLSNVTVGLHASGQIGILLDGKSNFTGIGSLKGINVQGSATNLVGIRGQNFVTATSISDGDINLPGSGSVCFDANNADIFMANPDCDAAGGSMLTTEGSNGRFYGTARADSGVTRVATWGTNTQNSVLFVRGVGFPPHGGNTITNNSMLNNSITTDLDNQFSNDAWSWKCTTARGNCSLIDMVNNQIPFEIVPRGNTFIGNAGRRTKIQNPESAAGGLFVDGAASGSVNLVVPSIAGSNTATLPANTGTIGELNLYQEWTGSQQFDAIANGKGFQLFNTAINCTTGASVGATCTTAAINLPVPYNDANYRIVCQEKSFVAGVPVIVSTTNSNASQFTITTAALTAAAAAYTSADCEASHN